MPPDGDESWRDAALLLDMRLAAEDALGFVADLDDEGNAKPGDTLWTPSQSASLVWMAYRNRMPESGTYGSVQGRSATGVPTRDP